MSGQHLEKPKRFKAGRLSLGDIAIRLMDEEGDGVIRRKNCRVVSISKKHIVCEIIMGSGKILKTTVFDKKTGINAKGEGFGRLENPKKPKKKEIIIPIKTQGEKNEKSSAEFYKYCN